MSNQTPPAPRKSPAAGIAIGLLLAALAAVTVILTGRIREANARNADTQAALARSGSELAQAQAALAKSRAEDAALQARVDQAAAAAAALEAQVRQARVAVLERTAMIEQAKAVAAGFKEQLDQATASVARLQAALDEAGRTAAAGSQAEAAKARAAEADLQARLAAASAEAARLRPLATRPRIMPVATHDSEFHGSHTLNVKSLLLLPLRLEITVIRGGLKNRQSKDLEEGASIDLDLKVGDRVEIANPDYDPVAVTIK